MESVTWSDDQLILLDQTKLPLHVEPLVCDCVDVTHDAIRRLVVRGAPAIGIAAAYGVCLARNQDGKFDHAAALTAIEFLATSRPTAVNLFWALDRMRVIVDASLEADQSATELYTQLVNEAKAIHDEDRGMCRRIGEHGAALLKSCSAVLTHCNAGGLATSEWGTALAPIYWLHEQGKTLQVFADETRPLLQGARLTAWELSQAGVPVTVCTDSMAGVLMKSGRVDAVIVGADRISANGDAANKIGTYSLAVLANYHRIPFYVAAPSSTFDLKLKSGSDIPIEHRHRGEVAEPFGCLVVPEGVDVFNPAFDVTPAELITAIITEHGVMKPSEVEARLTPFLSTNAE